MGTGSFPGVKRPGRSVDHPPSSAEVKESVQLHLYFSFWPSWPVLESTWAFITYSRLNFTYLAARPALTVPPQPFCRLTDLPHRDNVSYLYPFSCIISLPPLNSSNTATHLITIYAQCFKLQPRSSRQLRYSGLLRSAVNLKSAVLNIYASHYNPTPSKILVANIGLVLRIELLHQTAEQQGHCACVCDGNTNFNTKSSRCGPWHQEGTADVSGSGNVMEQCRRDQTLSGDQPSTFWEQRPAVTWASACEHNKQPLLTVFTLLTAHTQSPQKLQTRDALQVFQIMTLRTCKSRLTTFQRAHSII
jgi:hypothetical protein